MRRDEQLFRIGSELAESLVFRLTTASFQGHLPFRRAMLFFFCRAFKSYQAAALAWQSGFTEDATSLARTVYELRLQAIYLSRDPESRAKLFLTHCFKVAWGTLLLLRRQQRKERERGLQTEEREIREAAARAGLSHILDDSKDAERAIGRKWWDGSIRGKGIKGLVDELKLTGEYEFIYAQLSDVSHSGPRTLSMFVQQISANQIKMLCRPRLKSTLTVPWSLSDWMSQIVRMTAEAFKLTEFDQPDMARAMAKSVLHSAPASE